MRWLSDGHGALHVFERRVPSTGYTDARWEMLCGGTGTELEPYTDGSVRCRECRVRAERAWIGR